MQNSSLPAGSAEKRSKREHPGLPDPLPSLSLSLSLTARGRGSSSTAVPLGLDRSSPLGKRASAMKFWQRFLLLGSSFFLVGTVYYYIALDSSGVDRDLRLQRREVHVRLGETSFREVFKGFSQSLDSEVCAMRPGGAGGGGGVGGRVGSSPWANLSTVDLFYHADFNVLGDGMYELPTPPPDYPKTNIQPEKDTTNTTNKDNKNNKKNNIDKENMNPHDSRDPLPEDLEPLNVILMPHSHTDPGWQKTTSEYYADQTRHILTNMVNKLTEHPDLTFVWAETVYFALWWNELEDAVKVHVRRLIRRGQLEMVLGGWVVPDEASSHYVSVIDQLMEGHQWLWENLGVKPANSWAIDPFGHSGTMPYLWKLSGMDNMVIQRVHQAVKASLMSKRSLEFYWRQFWDPDGSSSDILCHVMPYMLYSIKFSCGPNRFVCLLFDFRSIPGEISNTRAQAITEGNVEKFSEYLYKQVRQKSYFFRYNTVLVPIGDDFRYDKEQEWDQQYGNYSLLMRYMNARRDWKVHVRFGTLKDYFRLTREEQLSKKFSGKGADFPVLSGDFFPYSDRNLDYWTGYYSTRPFDKRFQREVQGLIQAADASLTLLYALYKGWGRPVQEKFFHLASLMQAAHRAQAQFLHHDAITGTSRDFVVADFESQLLSAYAGCQNVMKMALQAMITKGKVETPYVFHPETVRRKHNEPPRKVTLTLPGDGLLVLVYNPVPRYLQQPVRLLVNTNLLYVKNQRREILPCQVNPVWEEEEVSGVKGEVYEVVFVADLPPLATVPFLLFPQSGLPASTQLARISVVNSETLVVPPHTLFPQNQPEAVRSRPVTIENERLRIRVKPSTGELLELEDKLTGNRTALRMGLEAYRSQGSGAYLFKPKSGSEPLISNPPLVRVVEGPVVSQLTVVYQPYITQTFSLYHHPALLSAALHVHNELNIQTLKDYEVIMRMKTDLRLKKAGFFTDQNGMQYIRRMTNENIGVEANYYPMTSGAFVDDGRKRVTLLSAQPHGAASLEPGWLEVMLDRQPVRDDGRGMEEGIRDIKPATSDFVLSVESRSVSPVNEGDPRSSPHHAFPSLQTLALGDRLQQPPQVFYSQVDSDVFFGAVQPMKAALPCDVALLSLRSLSTGNLNYNGTSLLLHRRPYDCDFAATVPLQCSTGGGGALTFQDLFQGLGLGVQTVRETSLTHLHHKRSLAPDSRLDLRPMQIGAYHLVF